MSKPKKLLICVFTLFLLGLFLKTGVAKAAITCSAGQTDCGSVCCDNSTQVCCLTGCKRAIDGCGGGGSGSIMNPILGNTSGQTGISFFQKAIPKLISLAFVVGAVIFFFILIIGAIQWISSGGDKAAVAAAKSKISNAIIGLIILISVYAVVLLIQNFFGIQILTLDIGALVI